MTTALVLHRVPGLRSSPSALAELGVIISALVAIGSVPALPLLLLWLLWRAWKAEEVERPRAWTWFAIAFLGMMFLMFVPSVARPALMQTSLWRWWLEYMSVRVAYREGKPLPRGQYFYIMMPHGLYPFSGACAALSKMVDVFPNMRMAVAPIGMRVPVIRQLMSWIGCILADKASISTAIKNGDSVCLFPGGIGEMMRTEDSKERIILASRKGFVRIALEHNIPIVPVYVFGQSILWKHVQLPSFVERLSRWLKASIILPYGRFGLLIPKKLPLLYAIGAPIQATLREGMPFEENVDATHTAVVSAVRELYDFYKSLYGWQDRPLSIE